MWPMEKCSGGLRVEHPFMFWFTSKKIEAFQERTVNIGINSSFNPIKFCINNPEIYIAIFIFTTTTKYYPLALIQMG